MSKPWFFFPSSCAANSFEITSFAFTPVFSARVLANVSSAVANFFTAYCSNPGCISP